jgi:hypothetical protein
VHRGTRQEAIRFAIQANGTHGQPLTNRDKRRAVKMVLEMSPGDSDHRIAQWCKVSHTLVANIRRQLATVASCAKRTGRDGKARRLPKTRKSPQPKPKSAHPQEADTGGEQEDQPTRHKASTDKPSTGQGDSQEGARQPKTYLDLNDAMARLEELLFAELQRWPEWGRRHLGDELRKFADLNCL